MSKYKPKAGDRVRVVLEGEVSYVETDAQESYFAITASHDRHRDQTGILPGLATVVSIEKVEPPVVTFKPGDVVRSKDDKYLVVLGGREYTYLANPHYDAGTAFPYGTHEGWGTREFFNSERFEKVEL